MLIELAALETPVILGLFAALFAPLAAYLVAARQFSGKIESSDAKELWAESRSIREWSQDRITMLEEQGRALEARVATLEEYNAHLSMEKRQLELQAEVRDKLITDLNAKIVELSVQLERAHKRIEELEKEVTNNGT